MAFRGAGVGIINAWGAYVQRWAFGQYLAAAGTYYPQTGEASELPGVTYFQLSPTVAVARVAVPFDMVPQRLTVFSRRNVNVGVVTYDLRHLDDTVSIATVVQDTTIPSYYDFTSVFGIAALAKDDILAVRVTHGVAAINLQGDVLITLTGYRTGV